MSCERLCRVDGVVGHQEANVVWENPEWSNTRNINCLYR